MLTMPADVNKPQGSIPEVSEITAYLTSLGADDNEVRESLRATPGVAGNPWMCPLALNLRQAFPGTYFAVTSGVIAWGANRLVNQVPATPLLRRVVEAIDDGA
jgi:hypothetical protein